VAAPDPSFGDLLRNFRAVAGLSQEVLSLRSGVGLDAISALERGARRFPHLTTVVLLAKGLGISPAEREALIVAARRRTPSAAPPVPRELPRPPADFTGRVAELAGLQALFAEDGMGNGEHPVVITAIEGMAGIGKSALAVHVAHQLAAAFPDGQLYVNLQGFTAGLPALEPLDALSRMLRSVGLEPAAIPSTVEEAAARFRSLVARRRLLVLLDNARGVEQVRPLLPGHSSCGVLITSRRPLATLDGAHVVHLDILSLEEAVDLLGRIIGPQRAAEEPEAVAEVVHWCGRLPLAIRVAGARLAARPHWSVRQLAEQLADAAGRLQALQAADLAVRASFDVSLRALRESADPLDRNAAGAFGLLGLPDGPDLGVPAAARLLGLPAAAAEALLERLVDAQLLEALGRGRYRFHDLVRVYARQEADRRPAPEQTAALERAIAFYTATAWRTLARLRPGDARLAAADPRWAGGGQAFPDASAALAWLETERPNLLAAVAQAAGAGRPGKAGISAAPPAALAGQLASALFGFCYVRNLWGDVLQMSKAVLDVAGQHHDRAARAGALADVGVACERLGRFEDAVSSLQESVDIFRALGDRHGQAASLSSLCVACYRLGRYEVAIAHVEESLAIFRELGDRRGHASALCNLSVCHLWLGRYEDAIAGLRESLVIFAELGDRQLQANTLNTLGVVHGRLGRPEEAIGCLQEGVELCRQLGNRQGEANGLNNLAGRYGRLGRYEEAVASVRACLNIVRKELADRHLEANSLNTLGVIQWRMGRSAAATSCQRRSLHIFRELGDRRGEAVALRDLGDALCAAGDHGRAAAAWEEALAIGEALRIAEVDEIRARLVGRDR
jgi:tetratricopeptide (TPR) repeat protein/transcriptional regulator with XRE-family HTH domain